MANRSPRWVATIGRRGVARVISRKAVQDVQINKACEKIIDPGAPLALRLQSNLLYGVSRIYSEQCRYVLDDAARVKATMTAFFRQMAAVDNETDPKAGKPPYVMPAQTSCR
jgi:meiotic recombination protein REC8